MTYKISVTGIDGSGKSTSVAKVAEKLSKHHTVGKVGRPAYVCGPEIQKKYVCSNLNKTIDAIHNFSDNIESKLLVAGVSAVSRFAITYIENNISQYNPEVTIYSRDKIIDPAVYSTFYFPFTKKWPVNLRINIAKNIQISRICSTIVYLDIDPRLAVERIEKRIEQEKKHSSDRNKWKHMHENVEELSSLRNYYFEALEHMEKKFNTEIITIKVDDKSLDQVSSSIETIIKNDLVKHKIKQ
ncbi:MAG TPA: hypothetical protein V6C58_09540 [Allocoleopsis sp.]